jgi:hypothetical protein
VLRFSSKNCIAGFFLTSSYISKIKSNDGNNNLMTKMKVKIMYNNPVVLTRMFVVNMSLFYMRSTRSSLLVSRHCCLLRSAVMVPEFMDPVQGL